MTMSMTSFLAPKQSRLPSTERRRNRDGQKKLRPVQTVTARKTERNFNRKSRRRESGPGRGRLGRRSDRPSECGCRSGTSDPLTSNQPAPPPSNRGRARSDQKWHLRLLRGLSKPNLPSTVRSCTLGATLSRLQRPRTWVRREVVELSKSEVSYDRKDRFDRRLFPGKSVPDPSFTTTLRQLRWMSQCNQRRA